LPPSSSRSSSYRIFTIAPEAQGLFKFGKIDTDDFDKKAFMRHARGVIATVDAAVGLLEKEDVETLASVLKDLGARHAKYGVKEEHFPIVGEALLYTLGQALADDFTPEVKEGWVGVYGVITQHMTRGLNRED
jgi:hemoglobin-like flavoprotein